jgi:hypothetical protein
VASVNPSVKTISWKTVSVNKEESVRAILLALFLVLAATFSIREHDPPPALSAAVAADVFSAGRAVQHLSVIAEKPHPVGSAGHKQVQDYLMKQLSDAGVEPQIQTAVAVRTGVPVPVAAVENVLGRLKGTSTGKAVVLVAHYDSTLNSFGATDNGSSIASLLETLRALKAGPPLKNDVIFLFTDGEESGLTGARAFVTEHPWSNDVGVVLNFDARGNSGPVIMFETSDNNGWLIEQFGEAAPLPVAHSLSYELYRLLPNSTDMNAFKKAGMPGLNFANIDGIERYHNPLDNMQGFDQSSMQHRGSYALALTRHLGNLDLSQPRSRNAIYFDLFGKWLVRYSTAWVIPLTLFITALFVTLLVLGLRRRILSGGEIGWGFAALIVSMVIPSLLAWLLWTVIWKIRTGPSAEATQSRLLFLAFVALAVATTLAVYAFASKRARSENLVMGAALWWVVLMLGVSVFLPGASFIFHWSLLFSFIGLGWMFLAPESKKKSNLVNSLILSVCALPAILLMAPLIYQIFVGMTLNWSVLVIALLVLLFGLLLPHLRLIAAPFKWALPGAAAAAAIVLLAVGVISNAAIADQPSSRIFYALNTDTGKAVWASDLSQRDQRTGQFFNGTEQKGTLADFAYKRTSSQYSLAEAPVLPLAAPEMSVLEDRSADGVRTLRLQLKSAREAGTLFLYLDSNAQVVDASVNKMPIEENPDQWGMYIEGIPREGVEFKLQIKTSEPLKIRLVDQSYVLPPVNSAANSQAALLAGRPDLTLLVKSFSL